MFHQKKKILSSEAPKTSIAHQWKLLLALCLVQLMVILDVTVVNIALPSIGKDLMLDRAAVSWVVTAYTLVFGSLLLIGGRLADIIGRRRMFLLGLSVFTFASLFCGFSDSGPMLIVGRLIQGAGAALLSPAALSILTTTFQGSARNHALGIWAAIGGVGSAIGVLLGGILTAGPGWQWVFFINVPVGLIVMIAIPHLIASVRPEKHEHLDIGGAIFLGLTAGLTIFGLIMAGSEGWSSILAIGPLAGGIVAALLFRMIERRVTSPLVPLEVLRRKSVIVGGIVMLSAAGLLISGFFLTSLYLQQIAGLSALSTGLLFLPVAIAMSISAHLNATLLGRFGWRRVALGGFLFTSVGYLLLSGLSGSSNVLLQVLPGFMIASAGITGMFVVATTSVMAKVDPHEAGLLSGLISVNHEFGASLGIAFVSALAGGSVHANVFASTEGFAAAFLGCAVVAFVVAIVASKLLPAGKPEAGQVLAH